MRLQAAGEAKERRLASLLAERGRAADDLRLAEVVADAQLLGSLALAGVKAHWDEVRGSRRTGEGPAAVLALRRAQHTVAAGAPLTVTAIRAWHAAIAGPVGFRAREREREDAPTTPPEWIEARLSTMEEWLTAAG
ncbi:MAG TPA: hypothetical protein VEQ10_07525, partial [Vicinamibacteria bacterium]|nr:hypothetical protein [Vicinamibacteria bacterium]